MSLVKNGHLTVPLFHGTSSLFYDSILTHGLGGRNILEDMGIRTSARFLVELAAQHREQEDFATDLNACECIASDPENPLQSNFRYCGTYLSPSRDTAARYAFLYYKNGGEALTHVLKLYRRLADLSPGFAKYRAQFAPLCDFAVAPSRPLLIEVADIEIHSLRSENGGTIEENLREMEATIDDPDLCDTWLQQHNFELTRPIPSNQLRFYEPLKIEESDGEGGSREALKILPFI